MTHTGRKLRVLHLIKGLGRGGAEMLLVEGLRTADRARFDYSYGYFLSWKDALVPALRDQHVEVTCFGARNNLQVLMAARRVASHLREQRIDILHCHLPLAGIVGRLAGRLANIPVVYTEHNQQERYHPLTRRGNALTWRLQAAVVAVSDDVATSIRKNVPSRRPLRVVLNGVDVDHFCRANADGGAVRRELGIPATAPVVGTVAVFRAQKGLEDWLAAASQLRQRFPEIHFLLVGDGPLRAAVTAAIRRHGLESVVHLPGLQEDVRPFLAAMQVYMMSSVFEGLPVALLEAMSMECVPVCTAVGGIPEIVDQRTNGKLTTPERPGELADAVGQVLADRRSLECCGAAARRTVEEKFSMHRMMAELETLYLEIAGVGGRARPDASTAAA